MRESLFEARQFEGGGLAKIWNRRVTIEDKAIKQLENVAKMPFVKPYVAAMPDAHWGLGSTIGSVIPTEGAVMPATIGVDIGCGMMAVRTNIQKHKTLPQWLPTLFKDISKAVPHGRTNNGQKGDRGAWFNVPEDIHAIWETEFDGAVSTFKTPYNEINTVFARHQGALSKNTENHLGTLGTGNHFIEVCEADKDDHLWVVIHSGSRGFGNRIGTYFTNLAKEWCDRWFVQLPDRDLAYFPRGTGEYNDYIKLLNLAQRYAWRNREIMMGRILKAIGAEYGTASHNVPNMGNVVHVHHNYMAEETHFGKKVLLTRKGAVRANVGDYVIIPGSMGARSFICSGLGSFHSFNSCSHGAGRTMSRTEARKKFTVADHEKATEGVECHKGAEVIDETPMAYKSIEAVMASQADLVEPVLALKQLLCIKGLDG